jgi:hypothetical protein
MTPEPVEPAGEEGSEGVAAATVLRRVQALAAVWGLVAGLGLATQGGWRRGVVLTLAAAVSIVALRSLEGVVRRLRVQSPADQMQSSADRVQSPADAVTPDSLGVGYVLRLFLLAVLVTILALGGRDPLALLLGLSAVPVALIGEALLQVLALRGEARREAGGQPGDGRGREP